MSEQKDRITYIAELMKQRLVGSADGSELKPPAELTPDQVLQGESLFGAKGSYLVTIEAMVSDPHIDFTCATSNDAIESIAEKISKLIDAAKENIEVTTPYKKERQAFEEYQAYNNKEFLNNWERLKGSIDFHYNSQQIDSDFYANEFKDNKPSSNGFNIAREEFLKQWNKILTIKEIEYELKILSDLRTRFMLSFRVKLNDCRDVAEKYNSDPLVLQLFWSNEQGKWDTNNSFNIIAQYGELFRKNKSIDTLISELGRESGVKGRKQQNIQKAVGAKCFSHAHKSDIAGISEGSDLSSLLPFEVAMLSEPLLERDFYKRYTEEKLQVFSYESKQISYSNSVKQQTCVELDKIGPFIVCVDTSGSMKGSRERVTKSVCYGLIIKAQEQNRNCYLLSYSVSIKALDISLVKQNGKEIIDFLTHSFCGGTDFTAAMRKSIEMFKDDKFENADVLFISDFEASSFKKEEKEAIAEAKTRGNRFHALIVGYGGEQKLIDDFDMQWYYREGEITLKQ